MEKRPKQQRQKRNPKGGSGGVFPRRKCSKCGEPGHRYAECPMKAAPAGSCFICGAQGHKKIDCPQNAKSRRKRKAPKDQQSDSLVVEASCSSQDQQQNQSQPHATQSAAAAATAAAAAAQEAAQPAANAQPARKAKSRAKKQKKHNSKHAETAAARDNTKKTSEDKLWHPFEADYCDHFATSKRAFADIAPVLRCLGEQAGHRTDSTKTPPSNSVVLYDPYYCDGAMKTIVEALGFPNIRHENVDFYQCIAHGFTPAHDVVVSNPPYSEDHKIKCMKYCVDNKRPWLLAMPIYVAKKAWWKAATSSLKFPPAYLVPKKKYEYNHPEGTGHSTSPFESCWFIGGVQTAEHAAGLQTCLRRMCSSPGAGLRVAFSLQELERSLGVVSTKKRPNPKQRKKRGLQKLFGGSDTTSTSGSHGYGRKHKRK